MEEREDAIRAFNMPDSDVFIFLLSIRAAGRGLNLQTSDTVIVYDPDPNPKNEEQAIARSHRIGQTKEVRVIHLESICDKPNYQHLVEQYGGPASEGTGVMAMDADRMRTLLADTKAAADMVELRDEKPPKDGDGPASPGLIKPANVALADSTERQATGKTKAMLPAQAKLPVQVSMIFRADGTLSISFEVDEAAVKGGPMFDCRKLTLDDLQIEGGRGEPIGGAGREYVHSVESLIRNVIQRTKIELASEVIDAGQFDLV